MEPVSPASVNSAISLPRPWVTDLEGWVDAITAHDGVRPFNDLGMRALRGDRPAQFWWVGQSDVEAIALLDPADGSVQLAVDPAHRHRGAGRALLEATLGAESHSWWSFGTLPDAIALATGVGLSPVRALLKMVRDLVAHPAEPVVVPAGVTITGFTEDDVDDLVAVNAAAFASHPEQGAMSADDLRVAMAEDWFDADDVLLARSSETGELLGFHWTKREAPHGGRPPLPSSDGEVYVIGVGPQHEGRGLGRVLLNAGLSHLSARGVDQVHLYVEAANERVVRMYQSASFVIELRDTAWARPSRPATMTEVSR